MNLVILLIAIVATATAIGFAPIPFLWVFLIWAGVCIVTAVRSDKTFIKVINVNLFVVFAVLVGGELYFFKQLTHEARQRANAVNEEEIPAGEKKYIRRHQQYLGFGPIPDNRVNKVLRNRKGETVYDVHYTIGPDALRVAPPFDDNAGERCILFFGGSFTFGEGLEDDQAIPYQVGVKTDGSYRVYNFGFHAYGPHQMLSALQHGIVREKIECEPKYVFYQAIRAHVTRSAGLMKRNRNGPRFTLRENGELFFNGHFDTDDAIEDPARPRSALYRVLGKSYLIRNIQQGTIEHGENIDLMVAILAESGKYVRENWPDSEFHVIFWDDWIRPKHLRLDWAMQDAGFTIHRISGMLPNYFEDRVRYQLSRGDRHPNALATGYISDYIVSDIIKYQTRN